MCQQDRTPKTASAPEQPRHGETPICRVVDSADLFEGTPELMIRHRDMFYRLRQTGSGKLILTK